MGTVALVVGLAAVVGGLQGLLGGGGGVLYVLVLLVGTDVSEHQALGTGIAAAAVGATVSVLAHQRGRTVDWSRARWFLVPGLVCTAAGGTLVAYVPARVLTALVALVYLVVGLLPLRLLRAPRTRPAAPGPGAPQPGAPQVGSRATDTGARDARPAGEPEGDGPRGRRTGRVLTGAVTGVTTGAFAISGGPLLSAYLTGRERCPADVAVGTAVAVVMPTCVLAAGTHLLAGRVDLGLLALLGVGAAAGAYGGSRLASHVRTRVLGPVLGVLTLGTFVAVVAR